MKKGFLLALLMAAMVALYAVPVYAEAPVIQTLDDVVIGDAGDTNGTLYLMRYNNIMDLSSPSVIVWNNATYTTDSFHVYYKDLGGGTTIAASAKNRLVTSLPTGDVTRLQGGQPPLTAGTEITSASASPSFFWLSLIDSTINAKAAVPMTNSYSATAAVNGVAKGAADTSVTYATTYAKQNTVQLWAAVTSGTGKVKTDSEDFLVAVVAGAADATSATVIKDEDLAPKNNWSYSDTGAAAGAGSGFTGGGTSYTSANGVGFSVTAADPTNIITANWTRKDAATKTKSFVTPFDGGAGLTKPVVKVTAQMRSTSAQVSGSPGFRLLGVNAAYTNMAALIYRQAGAGLAPNTAFSGNDRNATLMLACPLTLTDMGDSARVAAGAWLAGSPDAGTDGRDYAIFLDLAVYAASGEAGILTLEKLTVETFEAPTVALTSPAPIDFAGQFASWTVQGVTTTGFFAGTGSATASQITMTSGAWATAGNAKLVTAQPTLAACTSFVDKADSIVRFRSTLASSAVNAAPNYNLYITKQLAAGGARTQQFWSSVGSVNSSGARYTTSAPAFSAPTVPPTTAVVHDAYIFTDKVALATDFLFPQMQVWTTGAMGAGSPDTTGAFWPQQDGSILLTGFSMSYVQAP